MKDITLEELLAAGCHFGHQVTRANPKARDFVFEARDNIQIIDLAKTKEGLLEAAQFVKDLSAKGGSLLIVGTKRQAQEAVKKEMARVDQSRGQVYFIYDRWIGGVLTNFSEISKNIKKLSDLSAKVQSEDEKSKFTKKEVGLWEKEKIRLETLYGGIKTMTKLPDALYIIDSHLEELAVKEAKSMGVSTVAIVDTNADPNAVDYPIPANDDAAGSIELITSFIVDAWNEGADEAKRGARLQGEAADKGGRKANPSSPVQEEGKSQKAKAKSESSKKKSSKKPAKAKTKTKK